MVILPRGSPLFRLVPGVYAHEDAVGLTADVVLHGDQIEDSSSRYFEVASEPKDHYFLDSLYFRECQLHELPIWQASPGSATWKTSPNDPRERSKTWIDTYARDAQITKDDGSTQASWACIFEGSPYPLSKEFRAASSPVFGLYVVGEPNSTPMMDPVSQAPYGYEEHVPIYINTVDSTDVTGTALHWKMKAELRYVAETYPTGSLRSVGRETPEPVHLGGMVMYQSRHTLNYRRDTT